jgi:long-chain acyl-CoA synthetase
MVQFDPVLVHEWLSRSAERFPDKEALIFGEERWTYKQIDSASTRLALSLIESGVKRHDRVVVFLGNCTETVIAIYGILKSGGTFVVLEGSMKAPKLNYILRNSGARCVITHTGKSNIVQDALTGIKTSCHIVWVGSQFSIPEGFNGKMFSWDEMVPNSKHKVDPKSADKLPRIIDVDLAALIYTSGSTGEPKGVMSTHHNMVSAARSIIQYICNSEEDIILNVLPLSFDYGLYQILMAFMFGGTVVLESSFLYLHAVLNLIVKEKVTGFPVVPTILAMLLRMKDVKQYDFSSLHYITNTGAALPVEHIQKFRTLFPNIKIFSMFGLTECKRVGYLDPNLLDDKPGSVGEAMPNCEVFIVDENGNEVPNGEKGELVVRGSNVMQGYWNDPQLTEKMYRSGSYPEDRRLYSGDYFKRDGEGFLYFLGRGDDMIKVRGERVSAKEIESTLLKMEGVSEAAVVGVPDEILGQAVVIFIAPESGIQITQKEVQKFCSQNLESFAMPKCVEILKSLPKTPNGKIDKKQLKESIQTKS